MKKQSIIAIATIIAFFALSANAYGQQSREQKILQLDSLIKTFKILETRNAQAGIEPNPPGGGGPAFFMSNVKVPNDIRIEAEFGLNAPINALEYNYLVFEMMGETWEVMNDINEFYPRFRVNNDHAPFVQFQGSFIYRAQVDKVLDGKSQTWITVSVPIAVWNVHANRSDHQKVMSNTSFFLLRFIANKPPIKGRIYFRNLRLQTLEN